MLRTEDSPVWTQPKKSSFEKRNFTEGEGTGILESTKFMNNLHALIRSITE